MNHVIRFMIASLLLGSVFAAQSAPVSAESAASGFSVAIATAVVSGDTELLAISGELAVASVEIGAGAVVIVFESAASGIRHAIHFSSVAADALVATPGLVLKPVALASGTLLVHSGEVAAFIPNALGEALLAGGRYEG